MKLQDLLITYKETIDQIFKSFGLDEGYGEFDDKTDQFFCITEDSVCWQDEEFSEDEDTEYSNDIRWKHENETHYLLYVDNGCGDNFYQIFNKEKQIK